MRSGFACLSALRYISARAADILDCYSPDQMGEQAAWVPAQAFMQFTHTLCWGSFADLDMSLLEPLAPDDRSALLEELRLYHEHLILQRQRVERFHHAYQDWLHQRESELPKEYLGRLQRWRRRFGAQAYFRITGLATRSGFHQFLADPEKHMAAFEQAFADLAQQQTQTWQKWTDAGQFSAWHLDEPAAVSAQVEQALRLLGLPAHVPFAEVKRAYRRRAKMFHPDLQGENMADQMVAVNAAYHLLCQHYRR
jgi:hypothetical protein